MLSRLIFYPSLLYGIIMKKCADRRWYDRIDETVIVGALPFRSILPDLLTENVQAFVNMTEPYETHFFTYSPEELAERGIDHLRLSTRDIVAAPTQAQLDEGVQFILKHRKDGNSVYVHCKAGRTRSATMAACYLMKVNNWTPVQSIEFIKSKRPQVRIHYIQWKELKAYHKTRVVER